MTTYDTTFYDTIRAGCQSSAAVVAPLVYDLIHPETVIDVGCGEGHWAKAFEVLGCEAHGIDGPWGGQMLAAGQFHPWDLNAPLPGDGYAQRDLVISLEVAEHLPPERAVSFVADLCAFQPKAILFSAAIPGQTGTGHINCRWQSYWAGLFAERGYCNAVRSLRWQLWDDGRVEPWYRQNMVLYERTLTSEEQSGPMDVVHPEIWGWFH